MTLEFSQQLARVRQWAEAAQVEGWLSANDIAPLGDLRAGTPAALFDAGNHRPLVVAFFGGTGVGKSSLLNRMANEDVARVGVERPTSREVSIYAHESVHLRQLQDGLPLDRVRFAHHGDDRRRQVLWIDTPDIDSTAAENRDLVISWLPHIDVLIYVVSPERYRDDRGWRLLQEQGGSHAWLFVMNQWDRGCPEQLEDFRRLLGQGGFAAPIILTTDCRRGPRNPVDDEFAELENVIQSLADWHIVDQLERRSLSVRRKQMRELLAVCLRRLGTDEAWQRLITEWSNIWQETETVLIKGLEWPVRELAQSFVRHESNPLQKAIRLDAPEPPESRKATGVLWDDWAAMQLDDALNRLIIESASGIPMTKLRAGLEASASHCGRQLESRAQLCLRQALANPGNKLQRFGLRFSGAMAILLPLCAIGWVSWEAVSVYYASGKSHAGYLGADFAIHSALLIAIAWLLPYFVNLQLRPSTERVAERGLKLGVVQGLALIEDAIAAAIATIRQDCDARKQEALAIMEEAVVDDGEGQCASDVLARMLPEIRSMQPRRGG